MFQKIKRKNPGDTVVKQGVQLMAALHGLNVKQGRLRSTKTSFPTLLTIFLPSLPFL